MVNIIKSTEEFENLINGDKVVLIDLFATWCGPCRMIAPVIDAVAEKADGKYEVAKVDVDDLEEIAYQYGVSSIPTLLYFKGGKLLEKAVGLRGEEQIIETINKYL